MKWIAVITLCLAVLLYTLQQSQVVLEQREDGLYYKTDAETAFSGEGLVYHANGQKSQKGKIENGKPTGPWKLWHANGRVFWEGSYKDGKKDGVWTHHNETGAKVSESTWKDGVEEVPPPTPKFSPPIGPAAQTEQK